MGRNNTNIKNIFDRLAGDKVVWIIVVFLCMFSLLSIFSSTSQLASDTTSRLDIAKDQLLTILGGLVVIWVIYKWFGIKLIRNLSKLGFIVSFALLCILVLTAKNKLHIPFIEAKAINGANRWLQIKGVPISVYEIVKVAMVMYVAWAIDLLQSGGWKLLDRLSKRNRLGWLKKRFVQELILLYFPIIITAVLTLVGGASSAVFMAGVLFLMMLVCGIKFIDIVGMGVLSILALGGCFGLYKLTEDNEKPLFPRFATVLSDTRHGNHEENLKKLEIGTKEFYEELDAIRQPYGAKVAIKQGGPFGKGPGQSTQKYKVAVMYEDYMFSFLIEEYGLLLGGIFVIILYISLLARGSIIARNCSDRFSKIALAGLVLLIVGQAMFHITINCDIGILTGQTLPLISYGKTSFLCFSIAFGIILSISKSAEKKIQKETNAETPLIAFESDGQHDDVREGLNDLDSFDKEDTEID